MERNPRLPEQQATMATRIISNNMVANFCSCCLPTGGGVLANLSPGRIIGGQATPTVCCHTPVTLPLSVLRPILAGWHCMEPSPSRQATLAAAWASSQNFRLPRRADKRCISRARGKTGNPPRPEISEAICSLVLPFLTASLCFFFSFRLDMPCYW